jgi:hypothetical protein
MGGHGFDETGPSAGLGVFEAALTSIQVSSQVFQVSQVS